MPPRSAQAPFLRTHRARVWRSADEEPETIELQVVGRNGFDQRGALVVRQDAAGGWHWCGPGRVSRLEVKRPAGRPRLASVRAHTVTVWLDSEQSVNLRLDDSELAAFRIAAEPSGGVSTWLRELAAKNPRPRRVPLSTHLRALGRRAAGLDPMDPTTQARTAARGRKERTR